MEAKTKTREAITEHGSVEYEVTDCASCEIEVRLEDAEPIFAGEIRSETEWHDHYEVEFEEGTVEKGYLCEHCSASNVAITDSNPSSTLPSMPNLSPHGVLKTLIEAAVRFCVYPKHVTEDVLKDMGYDDMDADTGGIVAMVLSLSALAFLITLGVPPILAIIF
jgi:hypothetical protein